MTVLMVGIALALPAALYLTVANGRAVTAGWDRSTQMSVFLKPEVDDRRAAAAYETVSRWPEVESVRLVTRAEALAEYRATSGLSDILEGLETNPLPAVLLVRPRADNGSSAPAGELTARLAALPEADFAQLDLQWVRRLHAIMRLAERSAGVLAGGLGLGVLLVVANTTRLAIQGRRAEIEILKLFGATDAFVRRPFLYTGLWYGLLGAASAWLILAVAGFALEGPVAQLAELYASDYRLRGLGILGSAVLLGTGAGLGLLGAWAAVSRHLRAIEP
jgi:cell division transport system permease protein